MLLKNGWTFIPETLNVSPSSMAVRLKQAADVAEETFRNLHNQLDSIGNEESLVCTLYKNALKSLTYVQQTDPQNETLFPFEEDQELHDQDCET